MDFIKIEHASKRFGGVQALNDVSFSVQKGEIHGLVGENGSGKSTLIKILAGVLKADSGRIFIEGRQMTSYGPLAGIRRGISVIFQDLSLFPNLTVLENACLAGVVEGGRKFYNRKNYAARIQEIIDTLDIGVRLDDLVEELPIAKQQLIAIARALNNNSKLLIFDEPTTSLTREEINRLFKLIGMFRERGISIIFISHKLDEVAEICDTVTVLRDGTVVASRPMQELSVPEIERLMIGQSMVYRKNTDIEVDQKAPVVLKVSNLSKKNNFKDISFELRTGEILGVTGLLGSGRTELALALFGVAPYDSGEILLFDEPMTIKSVQHAVDHGIAYVPEDRLGQGLVMDYSIRANIALPTLDRCRKPSGLVDEQKISAIADRWIGMMRIMTDTMHKTVRTLSGGNQQKVVLAKWLEMNPKVLILDGPTVGVDIGAKAGIFQMINEMVLKNGMSVILISDEIREISAYCHRVLVMRNGRIDRILEDPEEIDDSYIQSLLDEQREIL